MIADLDTMRKTHIFPTSFLSCGLQPGTKNLHSTSFISILRARNSDQSIEGSLCKHLLLVRSSNSIVSQPGFLKKLWLSAPISVLVLLAIWNAVLTGHL